MPPLKAVFVTSYALIREKYIKCAAAGLIPVFAFFVFYVLDAIIGSVNETLAAFFFTLSLIFAVFPLLYGTFYCFFMLSEDGDFELANVFSAFSDASEYRRALFSGVVYYAAAAVIYASSVFPAETFSALTDGELFDALGVTAPLWTANIGDGIYKLLSVLGIVAAVYFILRFYAVCFLTAANGQLNPFRCMRIAFRLSGRTFFNFLLFTLAMLPLTVSSVFILPLIFTSPYIIMCYVIYCRYAVSFYNGVNTKQREGQR